MLVWFHVLVNSACVINFLVDRADELEEAIVCCLIYVIDSFYDETQRFTALIYLA